MPRLRPKAVSAASSASGRPAMTAPIWLAAGGDDMAGELRDEGDRALHALEDEGVDAGEIAAQQLAQPVEAGGRFPRIVLHFGNNKRHAPNSRSRPFSKGPPDEPGCPP